MIPFILVIALLNVIRGRDLFPGDKWVTAALSGLCAGYYADSAYVALIIFAWLRFWETFGWSFDEITGDYDPTKYPKWVQSIGLKYFPVDSLRTTNIKRGILMKGIRGMFLYPAFLALTPFNLVAPIVGLGCALQGLVYSCFRFLGAYNVMAAEFVWGAVMGLLFGIAV